MHIVQMANFHSPTSGGLRTALRELAAGYVARGHRVTRIVPGTTDRRLDVDGVTVHEVAAPVLPASGGYRMITRLGHVSSLLGSIDADVVELSDKTTLVRPARAWADRHGGRVVMLSHERIDSILAPRIPSAALLRRSADAWNRSLVRRTDAVVCASVFAAEEFTRIGAPVTLVPLGVDLERWRPETAGDDDTLRELSADPTIQLVMVGRLSREKHPEIGIDTVRALCRRGRSVHLLVVGDGPLRDGLVARSAGLPVDFVGHVADREALAALVRSAHVAIAPCPFETFGLAALEALASGVPTVVPDRGALHEVVDEGTGEVAAWHAEAFADAVEHLVGTDGPPRIDPDRGAACRRRAEGFAWSRAVEALLDRYTELHDGVAVSAATRPREGVGAR
jgi:alpha-1,6-mannosyltransferase